MSRCLTALALSLVVITQVRSENWPAWRGPSGQGHCNETNLPLKWSPTENVKWKVPLSDVGSSSPIVWGDKIFLTQATKGGGTRSLLCFNKADGKQLWKKDVEYADKERAWSPTLYGNASPVTDGERVVVSFGSAGLYCYDFEGKELWKKDLGKFEHQFGNSSSPIIYKDTVIFWGGPDKSNNFLAAFNKKTGEEVWRTNEKSGSWGTPVLATIDGKDQLLIGMSKKFKGFDPKDGKELWSCDGLTDLVYTSSLYSNGVAVAMSGYNGSALAVKVGGSGDITKDRLWHHPKNKQRVGSGSIVGDHIYILEETGEPHCYELQTGKEVWESDIEKKGRSTWSSMVVSGDRLYVLTKSGDTVVFAAKPKYEVLATNKLGDSTNASIAVSDGELFIRTSRSLWCISERK